MKTMPQLSLLGSACLLLLVSSACARPALSNFDVRWQNDEGASVRTALSRGEGTLNRLPSNANVAVGLTSQSRLIGLDLQTRKRWSFQHPMNDRPVLAGAVLIGQGNGQLFALDARDGRLLWEVPTEGALRGAGDDGATTAITLSVPQSGGSQLLLVKRNGEVRYRTQVEANLGTPAVGAGLAFVPWGGQYISILDTTSHREVGRAVLRHQVTRAAVRAGSVWAGELAFTRVDASFPDAHLDRATTVRLPTRKLPGDPHWAMDGSVPRPLSADAYDRIQLLAAPELGAKSYAVGYHRLVAGFLSETGQAQWAYVGAADLLAATTFASGPLASEGGQGSVGLCDDRGTVTLLDFESGGTQMQESLGESVMACLLQLDGLTLPNVEAPKPLLAQLEAAVLMRDAENVALQRMLLESLVRDRSGEVTRILIELADNRLTPPELNRGSREALRTRKDGLSYMLDALRLRYDFLSDRLFPPPAGPIADALAQEAFDENKSKHGEMAALLATHLNDPETPRNELPAIAATLIHRASAAEAPALQRFLAHYRTIDGEGENDLLLAALVPTAEALWKVGGRSNVEALVNDTNTNNWLRTQLRGLIARKLDEEAMAKAATEKAATEKAAADRASVERGRAGSSR
jgi:outer membrane protein assembly factor BamB